MILKILFLSILISFAISLQINSNLTPQNDENPCANLTTGYLPYEDDCSYFIYCYNQRPYVQRCPVGQIFDRNYLRCLFGDPETCEAFTTTTEPQTTPNLPFECPAVDDPLNPTFHPHPYICANYFMCFNGTALERECHYGLLWSVENEWCDFPQNVNCDRVTTSTSMPPPTPPPPFCSDWIMCPREGFGFLPNFNHCFRYFECIMAVRHMRTCPAGQIFDVITLRCDDPENALCVVDAECIE